MDFAAWIAEMIKPIATRVMVALGFGTVTYTGATSAIDGAIDAVKNTLGGLPADIAQLVAMSGIFDALAIASGSLTTAIAMMVLKKFALQTGGAS